jgi:putative hemolysin
MPGDPFQIDILPHAPLGRAAFIAARPLLERVLALKTFRALYRKTQERLDEPFDSRALCALDIRADVLRSDLDHIPSSGPLIIAANHPHGIVDGLILMTALRRVRADIRMLTNRVLARIPELRDCCLFVDPFEGRNAEARNRAGLRAAHLWLRGGGALIVFPAGEVAHARDTGGQRVDSVWKAAMSRLALATRAPVIPAFIAGTNSQMFYAAGRIHRVLRTLLLPRELLKQRGSTVALRFGPPIQVDQIAESAATATAIVRQAVESLAGAPRTTATPPPARDIAAEVAALSSGCRLLESGPFQVFCVRAEQIPAALHEIGRLRAITFRAVGEGSDANLDLDRFDVRYLHLFVWDNDKKQIVGAYRIGQTDRIVADAGAAGLYTRTLFRFDSRLIQRMQAPALELGRSFIRAEYQKNYNALMLLWKGIGRFIARNPEYRVLFGPVSISARYSDVSQQLLMTFLQQNHFAAELGALVTARHSPRSEPIPAAAVSIPRSVDAVNALVERAEADGKGMPVLLRQYLKLNARVIGFNVDPAFGNSLDALMLVDLTTVNLAILSRYLGSANARMFLTHHDANRQTSQAA